MALDWRSAVAVISCAALVITMVLLQRGLRGSSVLQRVAYALFPLSQLVAIVVLFFWIITLSLSDWLLAFSVLAALICCPVDVLLFRKLQQAQDKEFAEARVRMLSEQLEMQARYNAKLEEDMANIDRVRANARREFEKASALLAQDEQGDPAILFKDMTTAMGSATHRFCDNAVIDVIADVKHDDCVSAGINATFALDVPRKTPSVSDVELCAVLSNLIDNALDATKQAKAEDPDVAPFLRVASEVHGNTLTISTQNSMPRGPLHAQDKTALGKRPKTRAVFKSIEDHGWGLSIVEEIVTRHGGALTTKAEGDTFKASAILVFAEA